MVQLILLLKGVSILRILDKLVRWTDASTSAQAHRDAAPEEIQSLTTAAKRQSHLFPAWLQTELKTDHAGEYGAVEIYRGALQ